VEFISSNAQMDVDDKISSARYRSPLFTARIDRFIVENGKGPYLDME